MLQLSVIVPAYNEETTIIHVLEQVHSQDLERVALEVIVVDDGSKDNTVNLLKARSELYNQLIEMPRNSGKGAAVKAGLEVATGDYVLFQDADLEYSPDEYKKLIYPIFQFDADVVMSSRFVAPEVTRVAYFWNKLGNRLITLFFNVLNNTTFTDIYSCYILFRRRLLNPEVLRTEGWEQHAEILSLIRKKASKLYEVPISYHGRTIAEGKKIRAYHVLSVFWTIFICRFFR